MPCIHCIVLPIIIAYNYDVGVYKQWCHRCSWMQRHWFQKLLQGMVAITTSCGWKYTTCWKLQRYFISFSFAEQCLPMVAVVRPLLFLDITVRRSLSLWAPNPRTNPCRPWVPSSQPSHRPHTLKRTTEDSGEVCRPWSGRGSLAIPALQPVWKSKVLSLIKSKEEEFINAW